jgi:CYTH domain-containing protein
MRNTLELMNNTMKQYEIERKFLIKEIPPEVLETSKQTLIIQYYIFGDSEDMNHPSSCRIRESKFDNEVTYVKTIKRPCGSEFAQNEYETILTKEEFLELKEQASTKISKIRYTLEIENNKWEFDSFLDFDMHICEVEKLTTDLSEVKSIEVSIKNIKIPKIIEDVLIEEVTLDKKYSNKSLAIKL